MSILLQKSIWSVWGGLSRDCLDLDSYWLRTDLTRVHVQKVTEELIVSIFWRIIIIKPPSLTFWDRRRNTNITGQFLFLSIFFFTFVCLMTIEAFSIYLCWSTYLNRNDLYRWTLLCNLHTVSAPVPSWGIKDPLMRWDCKITTNSIRSEFCSIICVSIFLLLSDAAATISQETTCNHYLFQLPAISDVKVPLLRVESVPAVLWLESRNRPSLHVHRVGANPWRMHRSQVFQELRVAFATHIRLIEPGRLTGCRGKMSAMNSNNH